MKPSTAKSKGRETEQAWVDYLQEHGVPFAERRRLNGVDDRGDISGWVGRDPEGNQWRVVSEVKSGAVLAIPAWLKEADIETLNDGADTGHVVVRPKGKPNPEDWFVIMDVPRFMELMGWAGLLPQQVVS